MAIPFKRLCFTVLRSPRRNSPCPSTHKPILINRTFHSASTYRTRDDDKLDEIEGDEEEGEEEPESIQTGPPLPFNSQDFASSLHPEDRATYDALSPADKKEFEREAREFHEIMNSPEVEAELDAEVNKIAAEFAAEDESIPVPKPERIKVGLLAMGEDDEADIGEDPDFQGDDISSIAHKELEQHREMREYARIAAWEMPLLSKLSKPFVPPSSETPLRFRHTTYMGETHPASKKVVLEFCPADLPTLTPAQRLKLIKLAGPRYDPQKDLVKMSSEMFETQAQNKRYLGDLVDTLMAEAQDGKDTFEDVPVDFRHVKWKKRYIFPEAWKVTEERRKGLVEGREERGRLEEERRELGRVVDGMEAIEVALRTPVEVTPVSSLQQKKNLESSSLPGRKGPQRQRAR